ncbi:MAG: CRISPR-associated endonuclease Cas1 [Syntrophales bacterium]|jgi:CRISPR-associated protein Cas1|nr:CRISPR-associated endonuclease Cas1 [Syntrophales bacterium]
MVVYIKTQGSKIVKEGRHLLVKKKDAVHHTLFTYKLSQIVIFGNVDITHQAFVQLLRRGIDVVFLTYSGRYLGRIAAQEAKNIFLRKHQFRCIDDPEFTLRVCRAIVTGKLSNMATLLMRIKRSRNVGSPADNARAILDLIDPARRAESVESLRGYEGRGTALFFDAFPHGFVDNMGFSKRVRRPPTDPVNSVLSLLYTFLMNRVYTAVRIAGLDPYPGFLHTIDYGRYSLVLDLMEEFRSIIAETLTLSLFNLKILQKKDFIVEVSCPDEEETTEEEMPDVTKDPIGRISGDDAETELFDLPEQRMEEGAGGVGASSGKHPVKLRPEAFRRVIDAFEKKLTTAFYYPPAERRMSYGDAIIYQAGHFRKVIEGEAEMYQPVLLK